MSDQAAWDALRVIRLDRDFKLDLEPSSQPTNMAPWRRGWTETIVRAGRTEQFLDELDNAPKEGAVILLLHEVDLKMLTSGDLNGWLDGDSTGEGKRPRRQILVYSGRWGVRDYTKLITGLPARHAPRRWYTFGFRELMGDARPTAWLGHSLDLGLSLERVAQLRRLATRGGAGAGSNWAGRSAN